MAGQILNEVSLDEKERERYMSYLKWLNDMYSSRDYMHKKGREEGKKEEKKEHTREVVVD